MSDNRPPIQVGQVWKTKHGHEVQILGWAPGRGAPWQTSFVERAVDDYQVFAGTDGYMTNGDELVERIDMRFPPIVDPLSDDHEAPTFHTLAEPADSNAVTSTQVNDVQGDSVTTPFKVGIGDVTSTAKGSGARYNNGKPPLDLIPLCLIAADYQRESAGLSPEARAAVEALDALGMFQAREGGLLDVLSALGHGWADCAHVFDYGRRKYAAWNWAKGMPWSVPIACAARHLLAIIGGETTDPESGKSHVGHVYCNVVMLMTYQGTFTEGDDRPAKGMLL